MTDTHGMSVSEAIARRRSIRAFRPDPVDLDLVRRMLDKAARAANGCNFQPWVLRVVTGETRQALIDAAKARLAEGAESQAEYHIQPPDMPDAFQSRFFELGKLMYGHAGIGRDDRQARREFVTRNFEFFGAPVGLFFALDKRCSPNQWGSVGMFMQNFMLLAVEAGLDTCPQEAWAMHAAMVKEMLDIPADHILWSGMALGYRDADAEINGFTTAREPAAGFAKFFD